MKMHSQHSQHSDKKREIQRMKRLALLCLVLAFVLLVVSHINGNTGVWAWTAAFAEAALVGALADWFAVTALFRHPLGVPVPHTAIIPKNQARIARTLAQFVREKFLDAMVLLPRLREWNPAQKLGLFLSTPERVDYMSHRLQGWVVESIDALDAPAVEASLTELVQTQLRNWDTAPALAQLTQALAQSSHHEEVLNLALGKVGDWVGQDGVRTYVAERVADVARKEFPKLLWVSDRLNRTQDIADGLARRLAEAMVDEVQTVLRDPAHPLRERYGNEVDVLVQRLQHDADVQRRIEEMKQSMLDHPALKAYVGDLWQSVRDWLRADLSSPDSTVMARLRGYAAGLGERLQHDPLWQQTANAQIEIAAEHTAEQLDQFVPQYITEVVSSWDAAYLVQELELAVGKDLQYIRLNGTLIGGLIGLVLHGVFVLPWHDVQAWFLQFVT